MPQFILSRYTSNPNNMITKYNQAKSRLHLVPQPATLDAAEKSIKKYYEIVANASSTEMQIKHARSHAVQSCSKVRPESRINTQDDLIAQFLFGERERKRAQENI